MFDLEEYNITPITTTQSNPQKSLSPSTTDSTPQTPVSTRVQNMMQQYHDYNTSKLINPPVPKAEDGHNFLDCPKVWERIVNHPRFDEVEIEALCAELNAKVKIVCSWLK